jgi:alkylglycerol monooxygenase
MNLILFSIPIFFLLIGFEVLVDRLNGHNNYRFHDAITNISCGVGEQVTGIFFKIIVVTVYEVVFKKYALFHVSTGWVSGLCLFIGVDFFYYWFHRYSHTINLFWAGHVVHHQSEEYNLSVALRQGWFQKFFSFAFYLPLAFIGFAPAQFLIVSSVITLYQFWIHTKLIKKMGFLEWFLNTPSHHRVHHGVNSKYIDKNHAGALIIWDRMFGTFQAEEEDVIYGITVPISTWDPVKANFRQWVLIYRGLNKMQSFKDRLRYLYKPPGWDPGYMEKEFHADPSSQAKKYDTSAPRLVNYYVLFQFIITLGGATLLLFNTNKLSLIGRLISCALVTGSIVNFAALFESKKKAVALECLRVFFTGMCLYFYFHLQSVLWIGIMSLIVVISLIWLHRIKEATNA